jgi:hypothetical protein
MPGHHGKCGQKLEAALAALLQSATIAEAARKVHVSERTLRLWLKAPAFLAAYRAARRQLVEHAQGELQAAAGEAVAVLKRNLKAGRSADQIRAASVLLRHVLQVEELVVLTERVEELERRAAGWDSHAGVNGRHHR